MRKIIDKLKTIISTEIFLVVSLFIILICLALIPFSNITFTTNDDFKSFMNTWLSPLSLAMSQGRFQYIYQLPINRLPYFFNSLAITIIIRDLSHVALLLVIANSIYRITKSSKISMLFILLFFALLQNSNTHNLITSYPLYFHLGIISIFIAFNLFEEFSIKLNLSRGLLIFLLFFYGISTCESFVFFFALAPFFDHSTEKKLNSRIIAYLPFILSLIIFILVSLLWKNYFPSSYDGNVLKLSFAEIPIALKVAFQFTISALPAYFFFLQKLYNHSLYELLRQIDSVIFIKTVTTFLLSFYIINKYKFDNNFNERKPFALLAVTLFLAFIVNVLYGLTTKYRLWVTAGTPAYVGTFFSAIFFMICFAIIVSIISNYLQKKINPFFRLMSIFIFAFLISIVSLMIGISNQYINIQEKDMTAKIQLFNQFLSSEFYKGLNTRDIVIGSQLFEGLPGFSSDDWSNYVKKITNKDIEVVKAIDEQKVSDYDRQIYLDIIETDENPFNNILVVSEVGLNSDDMRLSNNVYLFANKPGVLNIFGKYINFENDSSGFRAFSDKIQDFTYNQNTFSVQLSTAWNTNGYISNVSTSQPFDVSSIQVSRNLTPLNFSSYSVRWGAGFYDIERSQTNQWRWSQQKSIVTINNTDGVPIPITLSANFTTGYTELSSIQIKSNLFSETIQVNNKGTFWTKTIELPKGSSQIEFVTDAEQVKAPKDYRQLFFSISDFTSLPVYKGVKSSTHFYIPKQYDIGVPLLNSDNEMAKFSGWYPSEQDHRWSEVKEPKINFNLGKLPDTPQLQLKMQATALVPQEVEVYINGAFISKAKFDTTLTSYVIRFSSNLLKPNEGNTLSFMIPIREKPSMIDPKNLDPRVLGIALKEFEIEATH